MPKKKTPAKTKTKRKSSSRAKRRCGLCGKTSNLTKTACCDTWICDDEDQYALFSYARNSCHRNHSRYTLCAYHHTEGHPGRWQECEQCRDDFETEIYVWNGTNEFNFEKLPNPPEYEPTKCSKCGNIIVLSEGGYSQGAGGYSCGKCAFR